MPHPSDPAEGEDDPVRGGSPRRRRGAQRLGAARSGMAPLVVGYLAIAVALILLFRR